MTSNHLLTRLLSHFQCPNTQGVFSADTLPSPSRMTSHPYAIVNCSPVRKPGSHFVLVCITSKTFKVYDPLASTWTQFVPDFQRYVHQHGLTFKQWRFKLQHPLSHYCGLHCVALCLMLAKYKWRVQAIQRFYVPLSRVKDQGPLNERRTYYFLMQEFNLNA